MQHVGLRLHSRFLVDCENNFNKCMAIILLKIITLTVGEVGHILIPIYLLFLGITMWVKTYLPSNATIL